MARQRTTTPTKPDDARAHRSIESLRNAFLQLLDKKSLEDITIKEIAEVAGLSYPTFFRRYGSKEELLADIATEEVVRLLSLSEKAFEGCGSSEPAEAVCAYIQSHWSLWNTLLTGGAAAAMREEFMRISREINASRVPTNPWLPEELAIRFVASGIFEIFAWWMDQPDGYPVGNVVKIFNELIVDLGNRPRNITLE